MRAAIENKKNNRYQNQYSPSSRKKPRKDQQKLTIAAIKKKSCRVYRCCTIYINPCNYLKVIKRCYSHGNLYASLSRQRCVLAQLTLNMFVNRFVPKALQKRQVILKTNLIYWLRTDSIFLLLSSVSLRTRLASRVSESVSTNNLRSNSSRISLS